MESSVLANEAAVAEVRKHTKSDDKKVAGGPDATTKPKPSIAASGIIRDLPQPPASKDTTNQESTAMGPLSSSGKLQNDPTTQHPLQVISSWPSNSGSSQKSDTVSPKVDQGRIPVRDRAQIVNQLLTLWAQNVPSNLEGQDTERSAGEKMEPSERVTPAASRGKAARIEEDDGDYIELFPRRESRPY